MTFSDNAVQNAPLLQALLGYAAQGRVSFHMPGHRDGAGLPVELRRRLAELDATELSVTDDLNDPAGPAADAMRMAAHAFGAAETLFVTGGSTTAIQAMVTAFCPRGSLIILPRTVHRSILNIAMLLQLKVAFIPSGMPPGPVSSLQPIEPPAAASLRQALAMHPEAQAVLVTSPDYFGSCPDLAALAAVAAEAGCPLLVDEAHGAHLCFAPAQLPASALAAGASACVQSAHKTLPALTQGAYLHRSHRAFLAGGRPWPDDGRLRQSLTLFQTSSPSLMIGATLDYARSFMQTAGASAIGATLTGIDRFRTMLSDRYRCSGPACRLETACADPVWRDPLRIVVDVLETGLTGLEIARRLTANRIDVEMADLRRLVLIPDLFRSESGLMSLAAALNQIAADQDRADGALLQATAPGNPRTHIQSLDATFYRWLQTPPAAAVEPVSPVLAGAPLKTVPLAAAAGQPIAEALVPYPPGIPLAWPGERLDGDRLALLPVLLENGFCVHGVSGQFTGGENENSVIRVTG